MSIILNGTTGITSPNIDSQVGNNTPAAGNFTNVNVSGTLTAGGGALSPQTGFKNRIINGSMTIDQRNAGASVTPTTVQYTLDRWQAIVSVTSKFSVQQNAGAVTPPAGFTNYLGATSLSAYSVDVTETFAVSQLIEGFNVSDLGWGTASAQSVTLSFWVRSSLTGTFGGSFRNSVPDRSYPFTYTISAANTWEQKTITIAGDTSGTWLTTNGVGIQVIFGLGSGTTRSGTAGVWAATNYSNATGATSVVGTNGATFYITGVQLEKGSVATPFEFRSIGQELALCQRYYQQLAQVTAATISTTTVTCWAAIPVTMRASPTVGQTGILTYQGDGANNQQQTAVGMGSNFSGAYYLYQVAVPNFSGLTTGRTGTLAVPGNNSHRIILTAEL